METPKQYPLATIAIPTLNRLEDLKRSLASALAQDYPLFEVIVLDNASTDGTRRWCQSVTEQDPRLRYFRQTETVDFSTNFESAFAASRGKYFMWLADDDIVDPNYLSECIDTLSQDPDYSLVGGQATMYFPNGATLRDSATLAVAPRSGDRVLEYLRGVSKNSIFYGVYRRSVLTTILPLPRAIGNDWVVVAACAAAGKIRTIDTTTIHRALRAADRDMRALARALGHGRLSSSMPQLTLTVVVSTKLIRILPAVSEMTTLQRTLLGMRCALTLGWRHIIRNRTRRCGFKLLRMALPKSRC